MFIFRLGGINERIDDVMTILAISIVADGRVANEEIEVFKKEFLIIYF